MRGRRFTPELKRSIIEQLLSETAGPAELCRRYNVSSGLLFTWKKQYAQGKLDSDPSREAELQARVRDLEQLLGKASTTGYVAGESATGLPPRIVVIGFRFIQT